MKTPQITIYAKSSGIEIGPYEKRSEGKPKEGRVALRFFTMESPPRQIRFVVEPYEAFEISRKIVRAGEERGKSAVTHRFEGSEGEVVTKLSIESYERNGKSGFALGIRRGNDEINVPMTESHFLYAAEFLRHLSVVQAWIESSI